MNCKKFTEHPASVNESYLQHLMFAWKKSMCFLRLSFVCFMHGLFPFLFVTTASDRIKEINDEMKERTDCNETGIDCCSD